MRLERCDLCHRWTLRGLTVVTASDKEGNLCAICVEGKDHVSIDVCKKCHGALLRMASKNGLEMRRVGE